MTNLIKRNQIITGIIGLAVVVTIIYFGFIRNASRSETILVTQTIIKQTVRLTGKIKPVTEAGLAFNQSGRVTMVPVQVGDQVKRGDLLVQLDSVEAYANFRQTQGSLMAAEAKLSEMRKGTRPEELIIAIDKSTNAERDLAMAKNVLLSAGQSAYSKIDDAIRNQTDKLFNSPRTNPSLEFTVNDTDLAVGLLISRRELEPILVTWEKELSQSITSNTEKNLLLVKDFLNRLALALNNLSDDYNSLPYTTTAVAKLNLANSRESVNTAIDSFNTAKSASNIADSALVSAKNDLNLKQAGNTPEQIQAQEAAVIQAEAALRAAEARLLQLSLRSPLDGIVTRQEAKVGELVTAGTIVAAVISAGTFEVEANVSEIDVAKLSVGNKGKVTLDAYGDSLEFLITLTKIDPAETIIEGVATYKIVLTFDQVDNRIRSGLTANLTIDGLSKANALVIPAKAITIRDGNKYVMVNASGKIVARLIKTGLTGQDGLIEIVSGLQVGDEVVVASSIL